MYDEGKGVDKNHKEAVKWYKKAAEQGDATAQYNLGVNYAEGQGIRKDYNEAFKWWTKAAEQGLAEAQYNLAIVYDEGRGASKNHKEAIKWYTKAAEQGHADAQLELKKELRAKKIEEIRRKKEIKIAGETKREHLRWKKYSKKLLVSGKLKIPDNATLLRMAGYSGNSSIRIIKSTLFLQNHLGYPTLDVYYFIFTTQGKRIKKVMTMLFNHGTNERQATNLLAYAPMLLYSKGRDSESERNADGTTSVWTGPKEFAHYVPREFESADVKEEYVVYPRKASYYIFHYGEEYKASESMFNGRQSYRDVCALILKNAPGARFRVGEGGKFHLTNFKSIYP